MHLFLHTVPLLPRPPAKDMKMLQQGGGGRRADDVGDDRGDRSVKSRTNAPDDSGPKPSSPPTGEGSSKMSEA